MHLVVAHIFCIHKITNIASLLFTINKNDEEMTIIILIVALIKYGNDNSV